MPVQNAEVARIFDQVADLLEIQTANPFRVRAYRVAAQTVRGLPRALHQLVARQEELSTDAHDTQQLGLMRLGVGDARRGWLSADDVLNTRPWGELKKLLRR